MNTITDQSAIGNRQSSIVNLPNRFPGVKPFAANEKALFFGRDRDIADLADLIRVEKISVLFGKSGYGKSSLLNAGVLPKLAPTFQIIEVRFNEYIAGQTPSPLKNLLRRLFEKTVERADFEFLQKNDWPKSLWLDLKRRESRPFLFVFDQFEEFFSYPASQQLAFKNQFADLFDDGMPEQIREAAQNLTRADRRRLAAPLEIHALFAIRADRMSDLNRLKNGLPVIMHKMYELRPLSTEQAREAIVRPALEKGAFSSPIFQFEEAALQKILTDLSASNTGLSSGVEAFQLQILCDSIESKVAGGFISDRDGNGLPDVGEADLPNFSQVFGEYYERRLHHLPENEQPVARQVIEEGLVRYDLATDSSRRLSVDGGALLQQFGPAGLSEELLYQLEGTFLVRREPNTLGGFNYELSHDTLLAPIAKAAKASRLARLELEKQAALAREKRANFRRRIATFLASGAGLAAILAIIASFFAVQKSREADRALDKLVENMVARIDADILKLNYDGAISTLNDALQLGKNDPKLARLLLEIAFFENETGGSQHTGLGAVEAARMLGKPFVQPVFEENNRAESRRLLLAEMRKIDPVAIAFLEKRYFPKLLQIPGGEFLMGRELQKDSGKLHELPRHPVKISPFQMAETETTYWQFNLFLRAKGRKIGESQPSFGSAGNHPLLFTDWLEACEYANWLSERDQKTPCYRIDSVGKTGREKWLVAHLADGTGWRLPSEAEWEFAAGNGARHTIFSWGDGPPVGKKGGNVYDENDHKNDPKETDFFPGYLDGFANTAPVGSFEPNDFGLFDMTGNAWEWCADAWHDSYLGAPADGSPWLDENPSNIERARRGGSYSYGPEHSRTANRTANVVHYRSRNLGFRLCE